MPLILYDTAARRKSPFSPLCAGRAGIYSCGPTVYRRVHIGNLRTFLLTDLLVRILRYDGCSVFSVQNITDMGHMHEEALDRGEDKVIAAARAAGKTGRQIAAEFTEAFFRDGRRMGLLPPDVSPRASEHVPRMIALVGELAEKGAVYGKDGYLYFDVAAAPGYGTLSGNVPGGGGTAERTDPSVHRHKKRPEDFALWLPAEAGREFRWESPWGTGWPGWHVECAAMSLAYLGAEFDVHVGGVDLRFPHHENSRALAAVATGKRFAMRWLHAAHLLVEGRKMSKSAGNEYTLDDLERRGVSPDDFRYYCLTLHYRTPMNFTWDGQAAAATALSRLRKAVARPSPGKTAADGAAEGYRERFREAVEDDLNFPRALGVAHESVRAGIGGEALSALAAEWEPVLGIALREAPGDAIGLPPDVAELASRRGACRREGRFAEADLLRERIREAGFDVEDERGGAQRLVRGERR
jgi:cysteinyl-tRNA synthetase